jgi:hypothetical protein
VLNILLEQTLIDFAGTGSLGMPRPGSLVRNRQVTHLPARVPLVCIVACTSSCGIDNSPGFDTEFVIYSYSQTLLAANIAFCGLHRDMPKEKLDLLELASRIMAEPCTGPP